MPSEGSAAPRLLVVGLAPALRGGNRTGLPFRGDSSGRWLRAALERHGLGEATGLNRLGPVHLLEKPHTEENFLMRELGYQVARTHAARLRRIVHAALFAAPLALTVLGLWLPPVPGAVAAILAVAAAAVGVLAERWLFFAEARHTAMLYYGQAA